LANIFDTHLHLDLIENFRDKIERAVSCGVTHFLHISELDNFDFSLNLKSNYKNKIFIAAGLTPFSINSDWKKKIHLLYEYENEIVAIGEIGIDLYHFKNRLKEQIELFEAQLEIAKELNKVVIIHSRDAFQYVLGILKKFDLKNNVIFHCFQGGRTEIKEIEKYKNFYVSFSGNITYKKNENLRDAVKEVLKEKILIETDSPYLAPHPHRGKKNEPSFIVETLKKINELKEEDLSKTIFENSIRAFNLE